MNHGSARVGSMPTLSMTRTSAQCEAMPAIEAATQPQRRTWSAKRELNNANTVTGCDHGAQCEAMQANEAATLTQPAHVVSKVRTQQNGIQSSNMQK